MAALNIERRITAVRPYILIGIAVLVLSPMDHLGANGQILQASTPSLPTDGTSADIRITDVRVSRSGSSAYIYASSMQNDGEQRLRLWRMANGKLDLIFEWLKILDFKVFENSTTDFVEVEQVGRVGVYPVGEVKPVLEISPPAKLERFRTYRPVDAKDGHLGIFLHYLVNGAPVFELYNSDDGHRWTKSSPPGLTGKLRDLQRIAPNAFGVEVESREAGTQLQWIFYRLGGPDGWEKLELPGLAVKVASIRPITDGDEIYALEVSPHPAGSTDTSGAQWYYRSRQDQWSEFHTVFPSAPKTIRSVRSFEGRTLIGLEDADERSHIEGAQWRYYSCSPSGDWQPVNPALAPKTPSLFSIIPFHGDTGLAYQAFENAETGRRSMHWTVVLRGSDGIWEPLKTGLQESKLIWDVKAFGGAAGGIGLQTIDTLPSGDDMGAWTWLVPQGTSWIPLSQLLSDGPTNVLDVHSLGLSGGVAIQTDQIAGTGKQPFNWYWYLPSSQGKLVEIADLIPLVGKQLNRAESDNVKMPSNNPADWREGVLVVTREDHLELWYIQDSHGTWTLLNANGTKPKIQ